MKVIGIVQKLEDKFYYSDVSKDNVSSVRDLTTKGKKVIESHEEEELVTESIEEGVHGLGDKYIMIPNGANLF